LNALADIAENNISLRKAAIIYGIPKSTLSERKANQNIGFHGGGTTTKLSQQTELILVHML
jgi:hypothetical protein